VGGVNYTTNVICNPLYTVYFTTANKDRLTVLKGLQPGREIKFILNPLTFLLIQDFKIPTKWQKALKLLPQETVLSEAQFNHLLNNYVPKLAFNNLPGLGKQQLLLSIISKLIAQSYKLRRCDDAP
jgi:response regulator of citrate/malate metabolism